jgi:two-component system CheB/CheR fusion protein
MKQKGPKSAVKSEAEKSGTPQKRKFPIVGIGASAGGLEASTALLKALPINLGMAFVVVPHLDPSRESAFGEILSRATSMPVLDAKDLITVEPDHVYVIPPNYEMTVSDGVLRLNHSDEPRSVRTTIDPFLRALATGGWRDGWRCTKSSSSRSTSNCCNETGWSWMRCTRIC